MSVNEYVNHWELFHEARTDERTDRQSDEVDNLLIHLHT